ncbi:MULTISPECIES: hypothetical protein [Pseudoalteromonas]|uniref:hypothetical protein n=1 Tax=Pseudoalteromonas TaxID=53246 RepID=UPI001581C19B|nr:MULTISPECIES: hypothetical protein [Pseudoalteromonas]MDI4651614.1 hypothetical protein [Pseudoalteromonas shioyasakiensis]NUJ37943.1 hypothetical protein [Pseudoalteromonas sp. 0303]
MKKLTATLGIAIALSLSACKSTPVDPAKLAEKESLSKVTLVKDIEVTPTGSERINKTRYLARNLMGTKDRKELAQRIANESPGWNVAEPTIGFIGAAALTGNPMSLEGSSQAVTIGAALDMASYIFDGSKEKIGQIWLPSEVNGKTIDTPEQAKTIAVELTFEALKTAFSNHGYDIKESGTMSKGYNLIYSGTLRPDANTSDFPNKPKHILAIVTSIDYQKIETIDPIEALSLGFKPAYRSSPAGHQITILGGHKVDENGQTLTATTESGHEIVDVQEVLWQKAIGRSLYRDISKEIPWVQGDDSYGNRYVVHNGYVYSFFSTSPNIFLTKQIDG